MPLKPPATRSTRRLPLPRSRHLTSGPRDGGRYAALLRAHAGGGLGEAFARAVETARMRIDEPTAHGRALAQVGSGVVAPALAAYVLHVLRHAERTGVRRLYFAARDGEVMLQIARPLAQRLGSAVELRYLYGSRQAWNASALTAVDDEALDWILQFPDQASPRMVLARLGLEPDDHLLELSAVDLGPETWDLPLTAAATAALGGALRAGGLQEAVLVSARERRTLLLRFLEQEGVLDGTPFGLVDVGWKGRPAAALSTVLADAGAPQPAHYYYFGLLSELSPRVQADREAYLFDVARGRRSGSDIDNLVAFDVFCTGREGLTVGYADDGEVVRPLLRSPRNEPALEWGLDSVRAAVDLFVTVLHFDAEVDLDGDLRPAIRAVLRAFFEQPTRAEARAWGAYPHSSDQNEGDLYSLARPISVRRAGRSLITGISGLDWHAGSRQLSGPIAAAMLGAPFRGMRRLRRTVAARRH